MTRRRRRGRRLRTYLAPLLVLAVVAGAAFYFMGMAESDGAPPSRRVSQSPEGPSPASAPGAPPERTAALPPLNLPADDAPHASAMEWWYYSGIVDAAPPASGRYAFHMAVFVANALVKHTVMHVALTDLKTGQRYNQ